MLELISPSPYEGYRLIPEDQALSIRERYINEHSVDLNYVFEPIKDETRRIKTIDLFKYLDKDE